MESKVASQKAEMESPCHLKVTGVHWFGFLGAGHGTQGFLHAG